MAAMKNLCVSEEWQFRLKHGTLSNHETKGESPWSASVSRLRAAGLAKESILGTPVTTPTRYLNIIPPDGFTPMIEPLPSKGIEALADMYPKITQGPGTLNGMKIKLEAEPDNMGELLQACFGADVLIRQPEIILSSLQASMTRSTSWFLLWITIA